MLLPHSIVYNRTNQHDSNMNIYRVFFLNSMLSRETSKGKDVLVSHNSINNIQFVQDSEGQEESLFTSWGWGALVNAYTHRDVRGIFCY